MMYALVPLILSSQESTDSVKEVVYRYESGAISSEGTLRNGEPDGYWKSYYRNGQLKTEGNRLNFLLDGIWKFYSAQGELSVSITYKEGKKNGVQTTWVDSLPLKEEPFKDDKRNGIVKEYDPRSHRLVRELPFVEGLEQGSGYVYDTLGVIQTLLTYKSGVLVRKQPINRTDRLGRKQGTWIEFHPNKQVKVEGTYRNDLKNGYWKFFKRNGALIRTEFWIDGVLQKDQTDAAQKVEIRKEIHPETGELKYVGSYLNGKKNGVQREYNLEGEVIKSSIYESGKLLEEGGYVDEQGRRQGHWKRFYQDGSLMHEGNYVDDMRTGQWTFYFPNGSIEQQGRYRLDEPEDMWIWFYPDGSTWREEEYLNGLLDGPSVEYDSLGTVIAKGEYVDGFREGEWFFEVGDHREEGKFFEGQRTGEWKHTYADIDQVQFEGSYDNGQENGMHIYYYPNGQVKRRGRYIYGNRNGLWEFFLENGLRYLTIQYDKNGQEVRYNGVKVKNERY